MIEKQDFPSKEFGVATGLEWIYVDYKLPDNPDYLADKLIGLRDNKGYKQINDLYKTLISLNPELNQLKKTRKGSIMFDICYGVISKFNINDIEFFSFNRRDSFLTSYNQSNRSLMKIIMKNTKADIQWVMSPTTFIRVIKELNIQTENL